MTGTAGFANIGSSAIADSPNQSWAHFRAASALNWKSLSDRKQFGVYASALESLTSSLNAREQAEGAAWLGRRLLQDGKVAAGLNLLNWLTEEISTRAEDWAPELRSNLALDLQAAQGGGPLGRRAESLVRSIADTATDPAMWGGMFVGGVLAQTVRAATWTRLASSSARSLFPTGLSARLLSQSAGFIAEVPAVLLATKGIHQAQGKTQDWSWEAMAQEGRALALNLLVLKGAGAIRPPAAWASPAFPHLAGLAGIYLAQGLEEALGDRAARDGAGRFADALAFWIAAQAGGRLSQALTGQWSPRFAQDLNLRMTSLRPGPGSFLPEGLLATAGGPRFMASSRGDAGGIPKPMLSLGGRISTRPAVDEKSFPEPVRQIRKILNDQNIQQRALLKLSLDRIEETIQDPVFFQMEFGQVSEWLAEVASLQKQQGESLLEHRSRLFDYQVAAGLHPGALSGYQAQEEQDSTFNYRILTQLELAWAGVRRSREPGNLVQIARRLHWVKTQPGFHPEGIPPALPPRISSIPEVGSKGFSRYTAGMELLTNYLYYWTGEDIQAFERAAMGAVKGQDIAVDESALGPSFTRTSAEDALRQTPDQFATLDMNYFVHQFSRLRLPHRHLQATLLGLWAAGNRLRLVTSAQNQADGMDVFLNDFPLLKVAFNLVPPQEPLKPLTSDDLDRSPHFMDAVKRHAFYYRHFEGPEGIALRLAIQENAGLENIQKLEFMKTAKMPYPDFPYDLLIDGAPGDNARDLAALGLGRRWIESHGTGDALYEQIEDYFSEGVPRAEPHMALWLADPAYRGLVQVVESEPRERTSEEPYKMVALGDIHRDWGSVQAILDHEFPGGNGIALAVGDLESYPPLLRGHQIYLVHGNHDNLQQVERMHAGRDRKNRNYTPFLAGDTLVLGGLTVAGLPGIYSAKHFHSSANGARKYYSSGDFDRVKALGDSIDIFLMHPAPGRIGFNKHGRDIGDPLLTDLLETVAPRLAFFGHHHYRFEGMLGNTHVVGLDYPKRSYVVLEQDRVFGDLKLTEYRAKFLSEKFGHRYGWQLGEETDSSSLFEGGIALENVKRIEEILETQYRDQVINSLAKAIEEQMDSDAAPARKASQAWNRAALSVNEAVPYVARYISKLEAEPDLDAAAKKKLLGQIFDQMTKGSVPLQVSDEVRAFEEFLKALKIAVL